MTSYIDKTSIIDNDVSIGNGSKIWHFCHISKGAIIGKECSLGQNVFIGENVKIGYRVKIQNNVSVYSGVILEEYVFCGPSVVFTNDLDPRSKYPKHGNYIKTIVKEGASIGANATIVCGVKIGKHAFIGAGSIVTKNVPDYALIYGTPAIPRGWICECGDKIKFNKSSAAKCKKCHIKYKKTDDKVIQIR